MKRLERERDGRITIAWLTEAYSRMGKTFPRRLQDALPRRNVPRQPVERMSEDEIFRNLDRHIRRAKTAERTQRARRAR